MARTPFDQPGEFEAYVAGYEHGSLPRIPFDKPLHANEIPHQLMWQRVAFSRGYESARRDLRIGAEMKFQRECAGLRCVEAA